MFEKRFSGACNVEHRGINHGVKGKANSAKKDLVSSQTGGQLLSLL